MLPILRRGLKTLAILLILLVLVASAGGYILLTRSFPRTNGTIKLGAGGISSLHHQVEIIRDASGVPNIYADNAEDLFFAQGYVHAQDRLWQMDLNRHVGHGQLAELFGDTDYGDSTTLKVDKFLRTIGLDRAAQADLDALDSQSRGYLQNYADGVNAFLHTHSDDLPLEFMLLGYRPAEWHAVDSLVWAKVIAYDLGGNYEEELLRAQMVEALGDVRVKQLIPSYPSSGPFIVPREVKTYATASPALAGSRGVPPFQVVPIGRTDLADLQRISSSLKQGVEGLGSNNWVVDGTRTVTGKPLLANDPHLGISIPTIWYLNGLHCTPVSTECPFEVIGHTFPGIPGVVVGHTQRIAWGVTNTGPDVQDLFIEKINPANPNQYWDQGEWVDMKLDSQVIHVKGGADVPLMVQYTRHGPIMTPVLKGVTTTLALEWTATHERSGIFKSLLALDASQNWSDFREALRFWDVPAQNFVYADVDGNIGLQVPGLIPIRAKGDGAVPVPAWNGDYDWTGYIPYDELPSVLNPPNHFIVSANNQVLPDDYRYLIAKDYAAPFRAQRIGELLGQKSKLSMEDLKKIQGDIYSLPLVKLQKQVTRVTPIGFLAQRAHKYVEAWDGNLTPNAIGGTILEVTYLYLVRDLLEPQLGPDLFGSYLKRGDVHHLLFDQMLDDPSHPMWNDPTTVEQETSQERVAKAYMEGVDWLGSQFGDWPPDWHWGRLHTATFAHPFGSVKPLNLLFNFGPVAVPGDSYTIFNTGFDPSKPYSDRTVSSMREIVDLSNLDNSVWIQTTGESGQPLNPHYSDLTPMWRDMQYAPLYFTRQAIEGAKSGDLMLEP